MPAMASRGKGRRTINEINMVPFIDVMLVLLIIVLVSAPLITPSTIDLPSVGKAAKQADHVVQVVISQTNQWELRSGSPEKKVSVNENDLVSSVRQAQGGDANSPVVISADKSVKYESVVKVMDLLQRAGIQRVGLSVQLQP